MTGTMRAAGIDRFGGDIGPRELDAPPTPGTDEVLVEVRAAGVGNWDDIPAMVRGTSGSSRRRPWAWRPPGWSRPWAARSGTWPWGTRGITPTEVYVGPDGPRLATLLGLLAAGAVPWRSARYPLDKAADALAHVRRGTHGTAIVLTF